jgi:hypothetical protein
LPQLRQEQAAMADHQSSTPAPTFNPGLAQTHWARRPRALTRQLARAELLHRPRPNDTGLEELRDLLAAALQSIKRGHLSAAQAKIVAALARQALDTTEALTRAGER